MWGSWHMREKRKLRGLSENDTIKYNGDEV